MSADATLHRELLDKLADIRRRPEEYATATWLLEQERLQCASS